MGNDFTIIEVTTFWRYIKFVAVAWKLHFIKCSLTIKVFEVTSGSETLAISFPRDIQAFRNRTKIEEDFANWICAVVPTKMKFVSRLAKFVDNSSFFEIETLLKTNMGWCRATISMELSLKLCVLAWVRVEFEIFMSVGKQPLLACYHVGDCETENNYFRVF